MINAPAAPAFCRAKSGVVSSLRVCLTHCPPPRLPPQIRRCFSPVRRLCGGLFNKKQKPQNEVKTKEKINPPRRAEVLDPLWGGFHKINAMAKQADSRVSLYA